MQVAARRIRTEDSGEIPRTDEGRRFIQSEAVFSTEEMGGSRAKMLLTFIQDTRVISDGV